MGQLLTRGDPVKRAYEPLRNMGDLRTALKDFLVADLFAVKFHVCFIVFRNGISREFQAYIGAPGTRISQNLSTHLRICHCRGASSDGTSRCRSLSSKLEFATQQMLHTVVVHH